MLHTPTSSIFSARGLRPAYAPSAAASDTPRPPVLGNRLSDAAAARVEAGERRRAGNPDYLPFSPSPAADLLASGEARPASGDLLASSPPSRRSGTLLPAGGAGRADPIPAPLIGADDDEILLRGRTVLLALCGTALLGMLMGAGFAVAIGLVTGGAL